MHPRLIAGDCSGGTCPAVYDTDPDLAADEVAVVGAKAPAGLAGRLAARTAPHEAAVTVRRELLEQAVRPAARPAGIAELQAQFETFSYSAFRLEAQQHYAGTGRDEQWIALLKASRRWGKTHQRVHVITEPLTAAMQQELTEGYEGNVAAGEDIRILPVAGDFLSPEWPADVPRADYWLFDSARLYAMHYELDGTWRGADLVTDPDRVVYACRARDAALHRAIHWRAYVTSRPELQHRLAQ